MVPQRPPVDAPDPRESCSPAFAPGLYSRFRRRVAAQARGIDGRLRCLYVVAQVPDEPQTQPGGVRGMPLHVQPRWGSVEGLRPTLANQLAVQVLQGNVLLTFGQALPRVID